MTDSRRFVSLHVKLLVVLLLGIALGVGVYFLSGRLGSAAIERYYLSREASQQRTRAIAREFQFYVSENGLSARDTDAIARWTMEKQDVYVLLYKDQHLAYMANSAGVHAGGVPPEGAPEPVLYPIHFRDGVYQAAVYEYSVDKLKDLVMIASLVLAFAAAALVLLVYNRRVTRAIVEVSQEVRRLGEGELSHQLRQRSGDELGLLTASVEQMRQSLLHKTEQEQKALQQNSELITAMSHDIRNPLTALLGYLDLASGGHYRTDEELRSYISAAHAKAGQLKALTDELFRYSLLFGADSAPPQLERYDAQILLGQLFEEYKVLLEQQGFQVRVVLPETVCTVRTDVTLLKRVFDNLFDNIRKYADPSEPISAAAEVGSRELRVRVSNGVRSDTARIESNRIGLRTCARILEQLGGRFSRTDAPDRFTAELILPVEPPENARSRPGN